MVEKDLIANPFGHEAQQFVENAMPEIRQRIDKAIRGGWILNYPGVNGVDSSSTSWALEKNQANPRISELRILDQKLRATKMSRYMISVLPKTSLKIKGFLGIKTDFEIVDYKVETEKGIGYRYDAGKRLEGCVEDGKEFDPFVPAITSEILFIEESGDVRLVDVSQNVKLNNTAVGSVNCEAILMGRVVEDKFTFVIDVLSAEDVEGKRIKSSFAKLYNPIMQSDGEIKFVGHDLGAEVEYDLPKPFTIKIKDDEDVAIKKGREKAARIARFMPNNFSQDQAKKMFANVVDGKVFTAGVINPLELAGVKNASKKSSK